jgi:hypothetical protein
MKVVEPGAANPMVQLERPFVKVERGHRESMRGKRDPSRRWPVVRHTRADGGCVRMGCALDVSAENQNDESVVEKQENSSLFVSSG